MSNSQVIARDEAECNQTLRVQLFFNCPQMHAIATNHIALPTTTLSPYP